MAKKQKLELTWVGKDKRVKLEPGVLVEEPEKSFGDSNSENMLIFGDNQEAKKEVKTFNPDDVFTTPKPERLIQRIFTIGSNENDWVLDSFAGSGTTGAVAQK